MVGGAKKKKIKNVPKIDRKEKKKKNQTLEKKCEQNSLSEDVPDVSDRVFTWPR